MIALEALGFVLVLAAFFGFVRLGFWALGFAFELFYMSAKVHRIRR